ncbi:MAG: hypothetical protein JW811_07465 [Clostridiales bacterium]|nr:hypothetical protein [Clostridiales bacterium]
MYNTGYTPGKGTYKCTKCGKEIVLENDSDALPVCPRCGNKTWTKAEK